MTQLSKLEVLKLMQDAAMDNKFKTDREPFLVSLKGGYAQGLALESSDVDVRVYSVPSLEEVLLGDSFKTRHVKMNEELEYTENSFKLLRNVFLSPNVDTSQLLWGANLKLKSSTRTQEWLNEYGLSTLALSYDKLAYSSLGSAKKSQASRLYLELYQFLVVLEFYKFYKKEQTQEELLFKLQNGRTLTDKVDLLEVKKGNQSEEAQLLFSSLLEQVEELTELSKADRPKRKEELFGAVRSFDTAVASDVLDMLNDRG